MASVDLDRTSIVSKRSIASVASILWPKIPRSSKTISTPLAHICSYIEATPDAQSSPIKELIVHKEEDGVQHEFLLLRLAKPTGEEFWVRLERKARIGTLSKLISSKSEANDMATLSGKRDTLLGSTKSVEKTRIIFRVLPSLTDLFHVLEALRESSKFYRVWPDPDKYEQRFRDESAQISSSLTISNARLFHEEIRNIPSASFARRHTTARRLKRRPSPACFDMGREDESHTVSYYLKS
ncbi:uncharacterized protein EI90DRAFT_3017729 [Cantharellus anzutake]|uniref:uncharacterized protein n=1 Tax=Cantharellus anzutake TaxID=1750568 RepID=UPI001907E0B2|nr:uncharacterized protein EI90DRAFT_3017729 [Cantharellus anzutake]KAF8328439.1 hypothetical protein EI90DRAFT_3017729 [Cantharellus anzutake]